MKKIIKSIMLSGLVSLKVFTSEASFVGETNFPNALKAKILGEAAASPKDFGNIQLVCKGWNNFIKSLDDKKNKVIWNVFYSNKTTEENNSKDDFFNRLDICTQKTPKLCGGDINNQIQYIKDKFPQYIEKMLDLDNKHLFKKLQEKISFYNKLEINPRRTRFVITHDQNKGAIIYTTNNIRTNGCIYMGEIEELQPHGKGILKYYKSGTCEGDFLKGMRHGKIISKQENGVIVSEGEYEDDKVYKRYLTDKNGNKFMIRYNEDGRTIKNGEITYKNGNFYRGPLNNEAQPYGKTGVLFCSNGDIHKGFFKKGLLYDNQKEYAENAITYANGDVYFGFFENGLPHGKGTLFIKTQGKHFDVIYDNGKRI